jgi:phosphoribosylaminoimidazolecarboxamide formyltransferase/IMP cyclohydrolase
MIESNDHDAPDGDLQPVRRALLSVYDKTGIADFARQLAERDVELISTGGTARVLRDADLAVTDVSEVTGHPEMLGGRVKTLHPAIHGSLLARRGHANDEREIEEHDLRPIDLAVVNLYPFGEAAGRDDASEADVLENIDIGGPTLLRAAAKNFYAAAPVSTPGDYDAVAQELSERDGKLSLETRRRLAGKAFARTAEYDEAIAAYYAPDETDESDADRLPDQLRVHLPQSAPLRYGENPHQQAALYGDPSPYFDKLHGKALSYNNLNDLAAALHLIDEFRDAGPTCAILKHTNPTGVATANTLEAAWQRAFSTDRQSPYGGIVAFNRPLDRPTAEAVDQIFTELILAPNFEDGVLSLLQENEKRRLVRSLAPARRDERLDLRAVPGGTLAQRRDPVLPPADTQRRNYEVVTERAPTDTEWRDLIFGWRVAKHVKSNAIVYAGKQATLGVGAGQMSRVDASELAVRKGQKSDLDFTGSVVASDAFFPFADGLEAAADAGAQAAIQPGGSIRDDEVIDAADDRDVAMVFTNQRHFRH